VEFDCAAFHDERQMYVALWKIKYNIDITAALPPFNEVLINYVNGA